MSHTLSIKLPDDLYEYLEEESERTGLSKGAIIRDALGSRIGGSNRVEKDEIRKARRSLQSKSRKKRDYDAELWKEVERLCRNPPENMTPEQEVIYHRNRRVVF